MSTHKDLGDGWSFHVYARGLGNGVHGYLSQELPLRVARTDGGDQADVAISTIAPSVQKAAESLAANLRDLADRLQAGNGIRERDHTLNLIAAELGLQPGTSHSMIVARLQERLKTNNDLEVKRVQMIDRLGDQIAQLKRTSLEAIWLRVDDAGDDDYHHQVLRVLVKLVGDTHWRVAVSYTIENITQTISHISESRGWNDKLPVDPLEDYNRWKETAFQPCATCAAKPGAPVLCASCLHNQRALDKLRTELGIIAKGAPQRLYRGLFGTSTQAAPTTGHDDLTVVDSDDTLEKLEKK